LKAPRPAWRGRGAVAQETAMSSPGFVHLHVHSAFSLLEGALRLGPLIERAIADKQPALGIADTANLFGAMEFSERAAEKGLQPIVGCELAVDFGDREDRPGAERRRSGKETVVLIAQTEAGYSNLSRLISRAYLEGDRTGAVAPVDWLAPESVAGLICLTGGAEGAITPLFADGMDGPAMARLAALEERFGDRLYVELQRHGTDLEARAEPALIEAAYDRGIALVATNEPFFESEDDFESHDALLAIASGTVLAQTERRRLTPEHRFKTRSEMLERFADLEEATRSTVEIARRVSFRPRTREPILPVFTRAGGAVDEKRELEREATDGLEKRISSMGLAPGTTREQYAERLEYELDVIESMNYAGYFLIVADFIQWAKAQGIPVGPGRGSGGGSLVAYALTITDPDPLRYNLVFERFLNPERVSMPDFDIDFCQERREEVIAYVQAKYGADHVAQIITFGTLQARAVLRDVGRVLQMPYSQVDRICKLVPVNPANPVSLGEAINQEPRLQAMRDEDETVAELLTIGKKLEGLYRHASTHAAGLVIGDRPLEELVPLYRDPRSDMPVTQYNLKWVEPAGLVKFDFLGLKTLTVIDHAVSMVNAAGEALDISRIPLDDQATFELYQRAETAGVFQVEGAGMRRALVELMPDRFEDIIGLVALYRPGPMDNIEAFCNRKHLREEPDYLDPRLKPVLEETYGIIVYQEQVMQIAQILSGFSMGEADVLRRAMGKKNKAEMARQKARFIEGAMGNGLTKGRAETIFELVNKFASYGFPKAHAVTYAMVSYQTAYLKAHHPREFLAASMTLDMDNTDKLNDFKREAERLGIDIEPPCVNRSDVKFSVEQGRIHYALCAIKGVGRHVAEHIVAVRGERPFSDLGDFAARIDPRIVGRRPLEALVNAGAFDALVERREQVFAAIDTILGFAQRAASGREDGIVDMFASERPEPIRLPANVEPWPAAERLTREHAAIGFYLSAHPLDAYQSLFDDLRVQPWAAFEKAVKAGVTAGRLAGTVIVREDRRTRRGSTMAIVTLSDPSGTYECFAFSDTLMQCGELIEVGRSVVVEVEAEARPDGVRLTLIQAQAIETAAERLSRRLTIFAGDAGCLSHVRERLEKGGEGAVSLILIRESGACEYEIELPGSYRVSPELASAVRAVPGVTDARLS